MSRVLYMFELLISGARTYVKSWLVYHMYLTWTLQGWQQLEHWSSLISQPSQRDCLKN